MTITDGRTDMNGFTQRNHIQMGSSRVPLVSVLLPVYNGASYLEEAIQSILSQTYSNFECIIINDGSTDESSSIIEKIRDPRIRVYNQANQGLAATLNRAIELAKGEYLARQDQDDISLAARFEKQIAFLESHPDYGMVGTWASIWEGNKETERKHMHPTETLILKFELLFNNPFVHSSMMIRKSVFEKVGLYSTDKSRQPPEDYELWSRIAREYNIANIPELLHIYREATRSMSRTGRNPFLDRVINIGAENLAWITGSSVHNKNITDLSALAHGAYHKLSRRPHFEEISNLLFEAVNKLSDSSNSKDDVLRNKAKSYLWSIRFHYLNHRYGKLLGKAILYVESILKGKNN